MHVQQEKQTKQRRPFQIFPTEVLVVTGSQHFYKNKSLKKFTKYYFK